MSDWQSAFLNSDKSADNSGYPPAFDDKYVGPGFKPSVTFKDTINGYSLPQYYSG